MLIFYLSEFRWIQIEQKQEEKFKELKMFCTERSLQQFTTVKMWLKGATFPTVQTVAAFVETQTSCPFHHMSPTPLSVPLSVAFKFKSTEDHVKHRVDIVLHAGVHSCGLPHNSI